MFYQHGIYSMLSECSISLRIAHSFRPRDHHLVGFWTISTRTAEYEESSLIAAKTEERRDDRRTTAASNLEKLRHRQDMMLAVLPSIRYRADMKPEPYRHGCARTAVRTFTKLNHMAKQAFSLSTPLLTDTSCLTALLNTLSHEQPLSR